MVTAAVDPPKLRMWLVFFTDSEDGWWAPLLSRGFRHVSAASYYADQNRWVYVNPTQRGLVIELWDEAEFGRRLSQLLEDSHHILRIPSRYDERLTPGLSWLCVGAIKSLLGVRARALVPKGLWKHLLSIGAEVVEFERPHGQTVRSPQATPGRPGCNAPA